MCQIQPTFIVFISERPFKISKGGAESMEDQKIIDLYFARNEIAIKESNNKYGSYCYTIANNILRNHENSEECVSDTWLKTWNAIPPSRPGILSAYLAKITRNLAINKFKYDMARKRGGSVTIIAIDELEECIRGASDTTAYYDTKELENTLNTFLASLPVRDSNIFMNRYFFVMTVSEIADKYGLKENTVSAVLSRTRKKLKEHLEKEGYIL